MRSIRKSSAFEELIYSQQESFINPEGFPLGDAIKNVLEKQNIPYIESNCRPGMDVRVEKVYLITLSPQQSLDHLEQLLNDVIFTEVAPREREDLRKPDIKGDQYLEYILSSPNDKANLYGMLDVATIRVRPSKGNYLKKFIKLVK